VKIIKCKICNIDIITENPNYRKYCKKCQLIRHKKCDKKYRENHTKQIKEKRRIYYETYREWIKEKHKKYRLDHKEQIKERSKEYRDNHKEGIKQYRESRKKENSDYQKRYYEINKHKKDVIEKKKKYYKLYCQRNREKKREWGRMWRINNLEKAKEIGRQSCRKRRKTPRGTLDHRMEVSIRKSLKGMKRGKKWEKLVGYTIDELVEHLEKQFKNGMSWTKFLDGEIHLDHRIPKSWFYYEKPEDEEFKKCWALKNLQPLEKLENLSKGNRYSN